MDHLLGQEPQFLLSSPSFKFCNAIANFFKYTCKGLRALVRVFGLP